MRAACALVAGVCGMVATEAFVFNPAAASTACRTASSRRQQQTRLVRAAAVTDSADSAVVAEGEGEEYDDAELEEGEVWSSWDAQSWPTRSEDYNAMPAEARNWEVENERLPVWEDEPNPVEELTGKEWYEVFKPSDVEVDAAAFGFDWTDQWFEDNGFTRVDLPSEEDAEKK